MGIARGDRENTFGLATAATHADTALHAHFKGEDHPLRREPHLLKDRLCKLDHDGRAAYNGNGVIRTGNLLLCNGGDKTYVICLAAFSSSVQDLLKKSLMW